MRGEVSVGRNEVVGALDDVGAGDGADGAADLFHGRDVRVVGALGHERGGQAGEVAAGELVDH